MKFLWWCCCVVLIALGAVVAAPYVIDWNARYGSYVFEQLGTVAKGRGVAIRAVGNISGRFIAPKLTVDNLYFECSEDVKGCSGTISVERLELDLSLLSIILNNTKVKSLNLYGLRTDINNLSDILLSQASGGVNRVRIFDSLVVSDAIGSVVRNSIYIKSGEIKARGTSLLANAELLIGESKYSFASEFEQSATGKSSRIELASESTRVSLSGNLSEDQGKEAASSYLEGLRWVLNAKTNDLSELARTVGVVTNTDMLGYVTSKEELTLEANIRNGKEGVFEVSDLDIKSASLSGKVQVGCSATAKCSAKFVFSLVDLDALFKTDVPESSDAYRSSLASVSHFPIVTSDMDARIDLDIKEIRYGGSPSKNLVATASIKDGKLAIDRLLLDLPGRDNRLQISGVTYNDEGDKVPRFIGTLSANGEDVDELLDWLFPVHYRGERGVYERKREFALESNLYIAPRIVAIRDIRLLSKLANISGDLKYKYDRRGGIVTGGITVSDFTTDGYSFDEGLDIKNRVMGFGWLRNVASPMQLNIELKNFLVAQRRVKELSFFVDISRRRMRMEKIRFSAVDGLEDISEVEGYAAVTLSSHGVRPKILLDLESSRYSSEFLWIPKFIHKGTIDSNDRKDKNSSVTKIVWSRAPIDLSGFEGIDGNVKIKIKKLLLGNRVLSNFSLLSTLKEGVMYVDKLAFRQGKGAVSVSGNVGMGDISSVSMVISASDVSIAGNDKGSRGKVRGNVSISGTLQAQGKNILEWVNSTKGKLKFAARGLDVKGVDFNGFITDLFNTESKAEVASLSRVYLYRGHTLFNTFEGEAQIDKGSLVSSLQFRLASAVGAASLSFFIPQFTITSLCRFSFVPPGGSSPANIDMNLQGPVWQPNPTFDIDQLFALSRYGK